MKIYNIIMLTIIAIGFNACNSDAKFENTQLIPIVDCNITLAVTPTEYTEMISGDVIEKLLTPTTINTYLGSDGTKTVCTEIGSAQIIRQ